LAIRILVGEGYGPNWNAWLTPRHLIEQAGPWDESLTKNQDGEFFCRVLLQASHIEFVPDATVYYRKPSAGNVSQNQSHEAAKSLLRSYQSYHREALKYEDSPRVRKALALNYLNFIYRIHPLYPDLQARAWESAEQLGHSFARQKVGGTNFRYLAQVLGLKGALKLRSWLSSQSKHA
jgi:GT2 family glycosyltransferase